MTQTYLQQLLKQSAPPLRQMVKHHITSDKVIRADKQKKHNYSDFIRMFGLFCLDKDKSVLDHLYVYSLQMQSQQFQTDKKQSITGGGQGGKLQKGMKAHKCKCSLFCSHGPRWIAKINYKQLWKKNPEFFYRILGGTLGLLQEDFCPKVCAIVGKAIQHSVRKYNASGKRILKILLC